jgi:hypothetical protein
VNSPEVKQEVVIDLSNMNKISQTFTSKSSAPVPSDLRSMPPSTIFEHVKQEIEDRALNKQYLEVRDFSNKSPYMKNFTGDPFR